jgi:hypothetical protein
MLGGFSGERSQLKAHVQQIKVRYLAWICAFQEELTGVSKYASPRERRLTKRRFISKVASLDDSENRSILFMKWK